MAMSNYYNSNPYNNNYSNYSGGYQQPQQQFQQQYLPLAVVNSKEEIERFIVQPNGALFLYCEPLKILCIKRADNIGRYTYETYKLNNENDQANNNGNIKYALLTDVQLLNEKINDLYKRLGVDTNVSEQQQ